MEAFEEFAEERQWLDDICRSHVSSLWTFKYEDREHGFALHTEDVKTAPRGLTALPRQLTSTITCVESLLSCRSDAADPVGGTEVIRELVGDVTKAAMARPFSNWKSDGSAEIYSRCRALPFLIRHLGDRRGLPIIERHLGEILRQMDRIPNRFAIGEALIPTTAAVDPNPYPPNAFHTYCALDLLRALRTCFPKYYDRLNAKRRLDHKTELMKMWARQQLGTQIALHAADSSTLDSDQLGWSIAIEVEFSKGLGSLLTDQDLIRHALKCLFSTQLPVGTWRHYQPLFHYKRAGNAYCYVFETFGRLLAAALPGDRVALRNLLQPHFGGLRQLARYAHATHSPCRDGKGMGWSSGHRASDPRPESWATASVFMFLENFRKLTALWTRDAALKRFRMVSAPTLASREKAVKTLLDRGDTWRPASEPSVGEELESAFVNRVRASARSGTAAFASDVADHDEPVIMEDQARSAILFGPPGTSKTTLARSMAGAVGWEFVEIHASDFVADGLTNVQRTADAIFRALAELDRCVVLFDEIDELVRSREGQSDAFGRFLTTSMLPKLAEIWDRRKILYFVATNHIGFFDAAIKRSGRFDLLLFVPPTSFQTKVKRLEELLNGNSKKKRQILLKQHQVDKQLAKIIENRDHDTTDDTIVEPGLAALLVTRWDELDEAAEHLRQSCGSATAIDKTLIAEALRKMRDNRFTKLGTYKGFVDQRASGGRDYRMRSAWPRAVPGSTEVAWEFSITGRRPLVRDHRFDEHARQFVRRRKTSASKRPGPRIKRKPPKRGR